MHKGSVRGLKRFLELKSIRENSPASIRARMKNPGGEGEFMQKALLSGAETYQIYGAVHMIRTRGSESDRNRADQLRWLLLYILYQSGNGHIRISKEDLAEDFPFWTDSISVAWNQMGSELSTLENIDALIKRNKGIFACLPGGTAPVVISPEGSSLYLLKRWRYERRFLQLLDPLCGETGLSCIPGAGNLSETLDRAYENLSRDSSLLMGPETRAAAGMVATRLLSVITGGPGTGKTTILGGLLRLLLEAGMDGGQKVMNIRLCAPTGRAAGRMEESLRALIGDPRYKDAFVREPCTLHKLLGLVPGSPPRFNRHRPLPADLLVVDEASMVDLNMMYYILDALRPGARLLLLGDKDQLPSVEAGALLSDFLYGREEPGYKLEGAVLSLTRVHRNSGAILDGSGMIIRGETDAFLSFLEQPQRQGVKENQEESGLFLYRDIPDFRTFLEQAAGDSGLAEMRRTIPPFTDSVSAWREHKAEISRYFRLFQEEVILVPSRKGLFGVNSLNRALSAYLAPGEGPVFHGQPIMITRNDYERELFNGDRGVILSFGGQFYAFFESPGSHPYRHYPVALLGEYQTAFALTIHKSQGSEYRHVSVIIPEGAERLLSREILYTGVTRAKDKVTLFSRKDLIQRSLSRGVRRHSGIREFISGTGGS